MSQHPIKVGIIGLGRAGWSIHIDSIKEDHRFVITAVADPDLERLSEAEAQFACASFSSAASLAMEGDVEVVVVATPSLQHASDATAVLKAGHHCILEKPMAANYQNAIALAELAHLQERHLLVHHQCTFSDEYLHMKEVVESGLLGSLVHTEVYWGNYARRWDWQTLRKNGGGELNNRCPHILSMVLPILGGSVSKVHSSLRNVKDAGDAEDHVHLLLRAEHGVTASITASCASALSGVRWLVIGSHGAASTDGSILTLRYYDPSKVPMPVVIDGAAPGRMYQQETLPWIETTTPLVPTKRYGSFYDHVYRVLREGETSHGSLKDALEVMRVIELARTDA